ncbi:helix-turn-helix domain-containing protein [Saccharothrix syringae]|uniref:XRE family transcriptional regulator n=1 Tax=Saccharothrix syringae TaxID=103733 RepID=A0A5Q0GR94_SACSY|nr:helix-turn-helix transcriptional regulator [Saccharothrix syringae]QFZ16596.1 XRE family transcriptional regulator [Saccharothrix syringae]
MLGAELREARRRAGMKVGALLEVLGFSARWLSKLESGHRQTDARNVARLLGAYHVDSETFKRVMDLCRDVDGGYLIQGHGVGGADEVSAVRRHEAAARQLFSYEAVGVPALVQSEDYMRELFGRSVHLSADEVERCVAARKARQKVLNVGVPVKRTFVVRELTLRHLSGDREVAWGQLMHLFWLGNTRKVDVRVVGQDASFGYWDLYSFTLMRSPQFRPVVHIGATPYSLLFDEPRDTGFYEESARLLLANAMGVEESRAFIAHLAEHVGESVSA